MNAITPEALRALFDQAGEFAVIDVRAQGTFSEKNIFQATTLPLSRLELLLGAALPRREVPVIVVSSCNDGLAARAAKKMDAFGYSDVRILEGGLEAWARAGLPLYSGTHVRSKAFSEVLEEELHVPWIDFDEFTKLKCAGRAIALFDSRSYAEYQRVTVPGAKSLAGAELVRHVRDQAPDPETLIVVTCGGRTRSIIGAQALINSGVPNRVVSLKDGTMGLRRDGIAMEHGAGRRPFHPSNDSIDWARAAASRVAASVSLRTIDAIQFAAWQRDESRTLYVFDVRTPEEYLSGHLPGSVSAQSGQLVQEIDTYAPVWNARIVLIDDQHLIRARMTASWLLQMGCSEVAVRTLGTGPHELEFGPQPQRMFVNTSYFELDGLHETQEADLAKALELHQVTVIDLALSPQYQVGHIPGALFVTRARLEERMRQIPLRSKVVLTSDDGVLARLCAADLRARAIEVSWLAGGTRAWQAAGLPLAQGFDHASDIIDDVWLPPPQRDGDVHMAITEYLEWELGLAEQVSRDPSVQFRIVNKGAA